MVGKRESVTSFLKESIASIQEIDVGELENANDTPIRELGMDSVKTINLIISIEKEFGLQFSDEELLIENFSTIDNITMNVLSKLETTNEV